MAPNDADEDTKRRQEVDVEIARLQTERRSSMPSTASPIARGAANCPICGNLVTLRDTAYALHFANTLAMRPCLMSHKPHKES